MRIRTVKPEFWSDEKIARLSEPSALLAIGLLNYADDEGYFNANEALIRAAIFPLREPSLSVARMMSELADIGYVRLGTSKDGRRIGVVVRFLLHQTVSRPSPSRLKALVQFTEDAQIVPDDVTESSRSPHGELSESSALNREQGTGKGTGKGDPTTTTGVLTEATDAQRLGWLKRKRAWTGSPADEAAWLGLLADFGSQPVDTAIEHLRRANPSKRYVDASDVQSFLEAGKQAVAGPDLDAIDQHALAVRRAIDRHGWKHCVAVAGIGNVHDEDTAVDVLVSKNRAAAVAMFAKLADALAQSGAA